MKDSRLIHFLRRLLVPAMPRRGTGEAAACLQHHIAPALGLSAEGEFERVETGANTTVFRWRTKREGVLYVRLWRWKRKHCPVRQHREAVRLFDQARVRTPELMFADDSMSTRLQWGVEVLVEREAEGPSLRHAGEARAEGFTSMLEDLARLHAIEGPAWHKPWQRKQGFTDPMILWGERLERFRDRITPETSALSATEIEAGLRLTREGLARVSGEKPVAVHGDVSQSHVHLGPDGRLVWIDLETVRFSRPEEDLAAAARMLRGQLLTTFLESYEAAAGRAIDRDALRTFSLLLHWERLNSRVQQRRRRKEKAKNGQEAGGRKRPAKLQKDQRMSEEALRLLIGENPFGESRQGSPPLSDR